MILVSRVLGVLGVLGVLACDTLEMPDAGDLEGYTSGELRSHRTSYCGGQLAIPGVAPATVLSVVYCDSYKAAEAECRNDPAGLVFEAGGQLFIECPTAYDGSGYARVYFLLIE